MKLLETLDWINPLDVAAQIPENEEDWVLLYSGMQTKHTGNYSFLALKKQKEITGGFKELAGRLSADKGTFENCWFGYLGYGLKNELEKLSEDSASFIKTPDLWFAKFGVIFVFDHKKQQVDLWVDSSSSPEFTRQIIAGSRNKSPHNLPLVHEDMEITISSNMTSAKYLEKVDYIKEAIKRGDLYQANLTRKFYGKISGNMRHFDIFKKLCEISPAPYSAFIKSGGLHIISSSPEQFLHVDKNGNATTRPIKGSGARHADTALDKTAISNLQNSEKDRAENLMIVDLSRNDLARNCDAGTIKVDELFSIETYATVHHMVSSISGKKSKNSSTLELIKGCFPPGSMTGTPKIKAMEICSRLEELKRGIYSGAIGWFGGDGTCDFSVVIRTIIMKENKFEFQVGGAIVNDSTATEEFAETMLKARGICGALGIKISRLEQL